MEIQLIDWINSFDDPHCVLVSRLPHDLSNGVILSHIVGHLVCTPQDKLKIFDLLNYPQDGQVMDVAQIRENFDLAYNVLQFSEMYRENPRLNFLEKEGITPDTLVQMNPIHLIKFVQSLQQIYFITEKPLNYSNAMKEE